MIESFRHKGLRALFQHDDRRKVRADQVRRLATILLALDLAETLDDLNRPSFRLHPLKGSYAGYWSIWINGNWRVVFRFEDGHVLDVDLVDYH